MASQTKLVRIFYGYYIVSFTMTGLIITRIIIIDNINYYFIIFIMYFKKIISSSCPTSENVNIYETFNGEKAAGRSKTS